MIRRSFRERPPPRGEMAEQVRARLAKEFGHASGESLRKWVEKRDRERS
jgi:hypothetical protein